MSEQENKKPPLGSEAASKEAKEVSPPENKPGNSVSPPSKNWLKLGIVAGMVVCLLGGAATYFFIGQQPAKVEEEAIGPHRLMVIANDYVGKKNYERAMVSAKELLQLEPDHTGATILVARLLVIEERVIEAADAANHVLTIDPGLAEPHAILAQIYRLQGQWDKALEEAREALIRDPKQGLAYKVIGEIYLRKGRTTDSIEVFREGLRHSPQDTEAMQKLSGAYIRAKDFHQAITILNQALQVEQGNPGIHFNLARAYSETNEGGKAIQHMERAEFLYTQNENSIWAAKSRHNKLAIARKFKMTPDLLGN